MLTFRKKIFITHLLVFLTFIALILTFSTYLVDSIIARTMTERAADLVRKIQSAPTDEALVRRLKDRKHQIFFRVGVITDDRQVLYDTHVKRLLGPRFTQEYVVEHPEVIEAFSKGLAFHIDYSDILGQKFYYLALRFDFHGKQYVMRTAVPYDYVSAVTRNFELGFIAIMSAVLFFFSSMTWIVINYLTSPISQITHAIGSYQEGQQEQLPEVRPLPKHRNDEFGKLASTLNSLSHRVQQHINTLTSERNEKEAILESLIEGVVAVDEALTVTYANGMALKVFGMDSKELVGNNFSTTGQQTCYDLLQSCQQQQQVLTDTLELQRERKKAFFDIVAAPKKEGRGAIIVLQDQSAHYRMIEMRKEFIANASHELKTPITIIRGFAETLHDNPGLKREIVVSVTSKIVRNCTKMTRLIRDLLALADIENLPASRLQTIDLTELIQQCFQTLRSMAPDAEVSLETTGAELFMMQGDPRLLELAFMNLLENGARYSNPPPRITVTISAEEQWHRLTFADKGIGIPSADLENIFQRFYTVNKAASQQKGGSGLGLSIVETIIHKHFGSISVESEVDQGTTFTILLPRTLDGTTPSQGEGAW